jgi:hypothetical protein
MILPKVAHSLGNWLIKYGEAEIGQQLLGMLKA